MNWYATAESPIDLLLVTGEDDDVIGIHLSGGKHAPTGAPAGERDDDRAEKVFVQLAEYFAGERTDFDISMRAAGTPFQREVWRALCDIPYGETISYGELARRVGRPGSSRAVGAANGRNPISIVVPCHRVIGANGTLTGYGGGLERKSWLLDHERRVAGAVLPYR